MSDEELQKHKDQLWDYKREIALDEAKSQESYDKTLITLAGGSLGLSITLLQFFTKDKQALNSPGFLLFAWIFWTASLIAVLYSFFASVRQMRSTMMLLDARVHDLATYDDCAKLNAEMNKDKNSTILRLLNTSSGALFVLGVSCFIVFVYTNL